MIRITTDRAIEDKIMKAREREFEKRLINETFERMDERLRKLEYEIDKLRLRIATCEAKTNVQTESKIGNRLE